MFLNEMDGSPQIAIRPHHIKLTDQGSVEGAFGNLELEISAGRLVQYFQYQNRWCSFRPSELAEFYKFKGWNPDSMFFGLVGHWFYDGTFTAVSAPQFLLFFQDGHVSVSSEFVQLCAKSCPADAA